MSRARRYDQVCAVTVFWVWDCGVSPQEVILDPGRISTTGMGLGRNESDHRITVAIVSERELPAAIPECRFVSAR
jgi:hypothetical protein